MKYLTTATLLNLRRSTQLISTHIIAKLPQNTEVEKISEHQQNPKWWYVKAYLANETAEGYVHSAYLKEHDEKTEYKTTPSNLNLRKEPFIGNNILSTLPMGSRVVKLSEHDPTWWKIRAKRNGKSYEGFVHQVYLEPIVASTASAYERYRTTASYLNFRKEPKTAANNVIVRLKEGTVVEKLEETNPEWWKIQTKISGRNTTGFVAHAYLEKIGPLDSDYHHSIPEAHLQNLNPVTRNNERWAFCLNESQMPFRVLSSNQAKRDSVIKIIAYLNVEKSQRYKPRSSSTYCNIYAYDYCYLNRVYIPRVWWSQAAIQQILADQNLTPIYADNVFEINANTIYRWLIDFGKNFGWNREFSLDEMQDAANKGKIALICAPNKNAGKSGHICAVVPETSTHTCTRYANGSVRYPLQSQAGVRNKSYFADSAWWLNTQTFDEFGFWIHD